MKPDTVLLACSHKNVVPPLTFGKGTNWQPLTFFRRSSTHADFLSHPFSLGWATAGVLAASALLFPAQAVAQDRYVWSALSHIILTPADGPHVADVEFLNGSVHITEITTHSLAIEGLEISVEADVGQGSRPDTITVTVPDGFFAHPERLTVNENETGHVLIYRYEQVGM